MRKTRFPALVVASAIAGGLVITGSIAAGTTAELRAQHEKEDTVRSIVSNVLPHSTVSRVSIHGRPLFLEDKNVVSTAYVNVSTDHQEMQWIIQNFKNDVISRLDMTVPVSLPNDPATGRAVQPKPVLDDARAFTPQGSVDGRKVTYAAAIEGGVLVVTADNAEVARIPLPATVQGNNAQGDGLLNVSTVFVSDEGLRVNLDTRNLKV